MAGMKGRSGGHNRTSDAQKRLRGTFRKDRAQGARADATQPQAPDRPAWLDADPIAVEAWDRTVVLMLGARTIRPADRDAVLLACKAESEFRAADELLLKSGLMIVVGESVVTHPAVRIRESAWRRWSAALATLGLQPISRERVMKAAPPERPLTGNRFVDV